MIIVGDCQQDFWIGQHKVLVQVCRGTSYIMIPSSESILRAKSILDSIEQLHAELATLFGTVPASTNFATKQRGRPPGSGGSKPSPSPRGKRQMSAAGRAAIVAAQKARWARIRSAGKGTPAEAGPVPAPKVAKKRKMSPEGRARIIAAAKARWAKARGKHSWK